jgi:acetylornithine deacetylase/succinyl-diaminopimelate desuccinylase
MTENDALELVQNLIRQPSPNPPGDISACSRVLMAVLDKEGIPYTLHEPQPGVQNLVTHLEGTIGNPDSGRSILINGHLDTVPPEAYDWEFNPYDAVFKDGYVYGRGSVDMKGGIASSLLAMMSIKRSGSKFNGRITFTAVGDEENFSLLGTKYLLSQGLIKADVAVCCEPTNLNLDLGNRGLVMIDVVVKGKSSHAGRPDIGINAIHIAAKIVNAIDNMSLPQFYDPAFEVPNSSCTVVGIDGGARLNVIPSRSLLYIDRRLMPGESGEDAVKGLAELIETTTGVKPDIGNDSGSSIIMMPEYWHEPCWTPLESDIAQIAYKVIEKRLNAPPQVRGKAAGTDASHLVSIGNIPTIIFGPGDFRLSHTSKEKIKLSDVVIASEILQEIVLEYLNDE